MRARDAYFKYDSLMKEFLIDLWGYLKVRKKLWLLPIFIILLVLGLLTTLTQNAAVAPLIYTLF